MAYIAIIGDFIDSKKLKNRSEVQEKLRKTMNRINQTYKVYLASPFTITIGDEFQALLCPNQDIFQIIDLIRSELYPIHIRFGIGIGDIVTDINPEQSIGADGPAYWNARSAIDLVHDKDDYGMTNIRVSLGQQENLQERMLNSLLANGEFIQAKWTDKQRKMLQQLLSTQQYDESFDHQNLARDLGIEPSALTKRLKASGLKVYLRGRKQAGQVLYDWSRDSKEDAK